MDLKTMSVNKGLTQQVLADRIGVDRTLISKIESGDSSPSVVTAKKIANELGFNWTEFFEGKEVR